MSIPENFTQRLDKKCGFSWGVENKVDVVKDKVDVVADKASDALKNKLTGKDSVISDIDWCGYIYDCLRDSKLPGGTNHYLGPLTFLILLYLDSTKFDKFPVVRTCPTIRNWSSYLMKQRQELELKDHVVGLLDLHDEWNEAEVQEYEGFIGFSETSEKEDEEDVNEGDKDPNGSNPSFDFSKISLEDFGNDSGPAEKDKAVEGNLTEQGTVVEANEAEEGEIMFTPENFTQWLEKNVDLVGEMIDSITDEYLYGDLFGDNSTTLKAMNQEITPEKIPTQKGSPSPKKKAMKPSSYLLSPYMNKKTNVVPKITRLKFILGNSLFAMQGDKMVIQSKSYEIHSESHVIYSESHMIHSETH
nr:hypothetical protein [Tanacetum cinerariifolium]